MKKFISILLALVMMLSLCTVAFAEDTSPKTFNTVVDDEKTTEVTENAASFDVKSKTNLLSGAHANIAYWVNVEWLVDTANIEINKGDLYKWDPINLKYVKDEGTAAGSTGDNKSVGVTITLTNSSNAAVNYEIAYADNTEDKLNTSEAAKENTANPATGTLANADTTAAATVDTESGFAYVINTEKLGTAGTASKAVYTADVTVTAVGDDDETANGAEIKLGTYTITLSEYVEPEPVVETKTVQEILNTVEGGFPKGESYGSTPANAWVDNSNKIAFVIESYNHLVLNGNAIQMDSVATKGDDGNYTYSEHNAVDEKDITITFSMSDNKLTSIHYIVTREGTGVVADSTFAPPAEPEPVVETKTIRDILPEDFPTSSKSAWTTDNTRVWLQGENLAIVQGDAGGGYSVNTQVEKVDDFTYRYEDLIFGMLNRDGTDLLSITVDNIKIYNPDLQHS